MNTIKQFDGCFTWSRLSDSDLGKAKAIFIHKNLIVDVDAVSLEFSSAGRDLDNCIVRCFEELAKIVGNASGELKCEIDDDDFEDPSYEFFTIRDSSLWRESGKLVRSGNARPIQWIDGKVVEI